MLRNSPQANQQMMKSSLYLDNCERYSSPLQHRLISNDEHLENLNCYEGMWDQIQTPSVQTETQWHNCPHKYNVPRYDDSKDSDEDEADLGLFIMPILLPLTF